jgi:hypothetical protein
MVMIRWSLLSALERNILKSSCMQESTSSNAEDGDRRQTVWLAG